MFSKKKPAETLKNLAFFLFHFVFFPLSGKFMSLLVTYFEKFGGKPVCYSDLRLYLPHLPVSEHDLFIKRAEETIQYSEQEVEGADDSSKKESDGKPKVLASVSLVSSFKTFYEFIYIFF